MSDNMGELTPLYTDKSIDFLKNKRNPMKPFILYLAHTMMHTIIDASDRYRGKPKGGLYGDGVEEFDYETGRLLADPLPTTRTSILSIISGSKSFSLFSTAAWAVEATTNPAEAVPSRDFWINSRRLDWLMEGFIS